MADRQSKRRKSTSGHATHSNKSGEWAAGADPSPSSSKAASLNAPASLGGSGPHSSRGSGRVKPSGRGGRSRSGKSGEKGEHVKSAEGASSSIATAVRFHCDYCRRDISSQIRIKCAKCTDFDLCLDCFSVGVELGSHQNDHSYQVVDQMNFPLFHEAWGADEELLLLEAIGLYGLGNWSDIADHVSTKTAKDCERHYHDTYISTPTAPLPDMSRRFAGAVDPRHRRPNARSKQTPTPQLSGGPKMMPDSGYMILRKEFETEHLNNIEGLIATLSSTDQSDPLPMQKLKLAILETYQRSLEQRYQVRQFVVNAGLLDIKKIQQSDRKRSPVDRAVSLKHQIFLQLLDRGEYEGFIEGIGREMKLKKQIQELQELRGEGFTTFYAAQEYLMTREKVPSDHYVFFYANNSSNQGHGSGRKYSSLHSLPAAAGSQSSMAMRGDADGGDSQRDLSRLEGGIEELDLHMADFKSVKKSRRLGTPLDITHSASLRLLSPKERELCSNIRLHPEQYMVIKDTLLRENMRLGHLKKSAARELIKIDLNKTSKLFDFFEASGWINSTKRHRAALASVD